MHSLRCACVCSVLTLSTVAATATPALAQGELIKDTIVDFRNLPTRETATWLAIGAVVASMGHIADGSTSDALYRSRGMDKLFSPGQTLGGARLQLAGALATYTIGRTTGNTRVTALGADLVRAHIMAQTLTAGIKLSVRRTRPDGTQYSFPSGHTSVSFAAATVVQQHFGWKAGVPAYAAASYVAASRIQDKRHYLSDVAFGAVVGVIAARTVTIGHGEHRFAVAPMVPQSGGFGVAFVRH
jgi:membrane-associated phospholipid phosphatase